MCGRYALYGSISDADLFKITGIREFSEHGGSMPHRSTFGDRWNIAPTQRAPVVRVGHDGRHEVAALRWGLVPPWADDLRFGAKTINARVETAAQKPAFRTAWKARRCLVPASGFYEWTATTPKRPTFFRRTDGGALFFAGLWESWTDKGTGEVVETYTILTRPPYDVVAPIHDRSPLVLPPASGAAWIGGKGGDAAELLGAAGPDLVGVPVGTSVNSARNEGPELVEPRAE